MGSCTLFSYHIALQDPKLQVRAFNANPKTTMEKLIEGAVVPNDPKAVAAYLHSTSNLTKKAIGEFFAVDSELVRQVVPAFIQLLELSRDELVPALRGFFNTFQLSGESQVIDRILESFSSWFCDNNPKSVFSSASGSTSPMFIPP